MKRPQGCPLGTLLKAQRLSKPTKPGAQAQPPSASSSAIAETVEARRFMRILSFRFANLRV